MAVEQKRSMMLIPGGQREMRHSRSDAQTITLVDRHRGFLRQAFKYGLKLVPVFSFGEHKILDNVRAASVQAFFTKYFGFGVVHWPYGRWFSPLPNPVHVSVVVGEPIDVPQIPEPTEDQVKQLHTKYYDNLTALFEKHKAQCGYGNARLEFSSQ
jgi:1-acyl-sn-glycerol-3-phosphate acyltransferase